MYCTEQEFQRYAPAAQRYVDPDRLILGWTVYSGSVYQASAGGSIAVLKSGGSEMTLCESLAAVDTTSEYYYNQDLDLVYFYSTTDPDQLEMVATEDRETYIDWLMGEASRHLDAMLDARFQTPFLKDRDGLYDSVIIRATAYMAAYIITLDKNTELAEIYGDRLVNEMGTGIIDKLNDARLKLKIEVDTESARGEIREVGAAFSGLPLNFNDVDEDFNSLSIAGGIRMVETSGEAFGVLWDLIKVAITTAGTIGTATYSTYIRDDTDKVLKGSLSVQNEVINGQPQYLGYGLYGRFGGYTGATAVVGDEWEVEVRGSEQAVTHGVNTMRAVRS